MAIRPNPRSMIPALRLEDLTPALVTAALDRVPSYGPTGYRRLAEDTVGAIHQLPRLFRAASGELFDLKDIVAYFGRSSAARDEPGLNVYARFREGFQARGDDFGLIFAQTTIAASRAFERWGIALIDFMKSRDGLCISNRTQYCRGSVGSTEPGYLYMTFHFARGREAAGVLSQAEIDRGAREILPAIDGNMPSVDRRTMAGATAACLDRANKLKWVGPRPVRLVTG